MAGKKKPKKSETGCCPRFDPGPWDKKEFTWKDKLFVKDRVTSIFHIPLNFGGVMKRNMEKIEKADALAPEWLLLSDENSLWGADLYFAVTTKVPDCEMVKFSGTFLSKVFEGPYKDMGKWAEQMKGYVESKDRKLKKMYYYYTTCPGCAKHYGKNYVVLLAKVWVVS